MRCFINIRPWIVFVNGPLVFNLYQTCDVFYHVHVSVSCCISCQSGRQLYCSPVLERLVQQCLHINNLLFINYQKKANPFGEQKQHIRSDSVSLSHELFQNEVLIQTENM